MKKLLLASTALAALSIYATPVSAAPISTYPNASTPLTGSEASIGTQGAATVQITTGSVSTLANSPGVRAGLPAASVPLTGNETVAATQGSTTVRLTTAAIANLTFPPISPLAYGAIGNDSADDTAAWNRAIAAATATGSPIEGGGLTYKITSGLSYDVSKIAVNCQGGGLDFRSMSSGAALTFTSSQTDPNAMGETQTPHPLSDCTLYGPTYTAGVDAIHFTPAIISGSPWMWGVVLDRLGFLGFNNELLIPAGVFDVTLNDPTVGAIGAIVPGTFLALNIATAENIQVNHGFMANLQVACFDDLSGNSTGDIYARDTSCDGTPVVDGGGTAGNLSSNFSLFYDGHIEGVIVSSNYVINLTSNGYFDWRGGQWLQQGNLTHTPCNAGNGTDGGVTISGVQFYAGGTAFVPTSQYFCDGTAQVRISGSSPLGITQLGMFSQSRNLISNFANPNLTSWTTSGTVTVSSTVPTGVVPTVTKSIEIAGNSSASPQVSFTAPCGPNEIVSAQAYMETTGVANATATWFSYITFEDAAGVALGDYLISGTSDIANFTREVTDSAQTPAPPGTTQCKYQPGITGGSGNVTMYVALPMMVTH